MLNRLDQFIDRLDATESIDDLQQLIESLRDLYQVDNVVFHAINLDGSPYAALTYTNEWVDHYVESRYLEVDPVVRGAASQFVPIDWKRLDWSSKGSRAFMGEAIGAGVGNQGYTVPVRGPDGQFAIFTVNQNAKDAEWNKFTRENSRDFLLISHYFHQRVTRLLAPQDDWDSADLSPRERDALRYLGCGLGRGQIAEKLQISEHTLRVYIDTARYKLGALNTTHAVAVALTRGLISL